MAIGSTILVFTVQLADLDRGVYADFTIRVARHPSETDAFMLTRVLAYCLEYEAGIEFGGGVSTAEDPAVLVRDATGRVTAWIEVGAPDAARVHAGSKRADRAVVYTHRDPAKVLASWSGRTIHRSDELVLRSFDRGFIDAAASEIGRRNALSLSVTEGQLYGELNGVALGTGVHEHRLA